MNLRDVWRCVRYHVVQALRALELRLKRFGMRGIEHGSDAVQHPGGRCGIAAPPPMRAGDVMSAIFTNMGRASPEK
jgi:hypothetical protein